MESSVGADPFDSIDICCLCFILLLEIKAPLARYRLFFPLQLGDAPAKEDKAEQLSPLQ